VRIVSQTSSGHLTDASQALIDLDGDKADRGRNDPPAISILKDAPTKPRPSVTNAKVVTPFGPKPGRKLPTIAPASTPFPFKRMKPFDEALSPAVQRKIFGPGGPKPAAPSLPTAWGIVGYKPMAGGDALVTLSGNYSFTPNLKGAPSDDPFSDAGEHWATPPDAAPQEITFQASGSTARKLDGVDLLVGKPDQLARVWSWRPVEVSFEPDPQAPLYTFLVDVPLLRVHCPRQQGSEAVLTLRNEAESEGELGLTLAGTGTKAATNIRCAVEAAYPVSASCKEWYAPGRFTLVFGWTRLNDSRIAYGAQVVLLGLDVQKERAIPPENDACTWPADRLTALEPEINRSNVTSTTDVPHRSWQLQTKQRGSFQVGISSATGSIGCGITFTQTTLQSLTVKTSFGPGGVYRPHRAEGGCPLPELCWPDVPVA
jgi:hypothetical protein